MIDSRAYIRGHKVWPHCDLALLGAEGGITFLSHGGVIFPQRGNIFS